MNLVKKGNGLVIIQKLLCRLDIEMGQCENKLVFFEEMSINRKSYDGTLKSLKETFNINCCK